MRKAAATLRDGSKAPVPLERHDPAPIIAEHQRRSSRTLSRVGLILALANLPFPLGVFLFVDRTLELLAVVVAFAALEGGALLLFRQGLHRPWMDWLTTLAEASTPVAILLLDAARVGPAYALTSAPILLFALVVLFSAMRLRPWLSVLSGAASAGSMLAAYLYLRADIPPALTALVPSLGWQNVAQRVVYVLMGGAGAFWICTSLLRLIVDLATSTRRELETRMVLGRQVSDAVAEEILSGRAAVGQKKVVTVLFSDIRSFTSFSETRDPAEVVEFLNAYFAAMVAVVHAHGGLVNKFLGDGLMALFGAPSPDPKHAEHAVLAALEMQRVAHAARSHWGVPDLEIGIGVHTGEAVVGVLGSRARSEYTAIGDTVNLAARIEALTKPLGTRVLISAETRAALGDAFPVRALGESQVKGREKPVAIYEPLSDSLERRPSPPLSAPSA